MGPVYRALGLPSISALNTWGLDSPCNLRPFLRLVKGGPQPMRLSLNSTLSPCTPATTPPELIAPTKPARLGPGVAEGPYVRAAGAALLPQVSPLTNPSNSRARPGLPPCPYAGGSPHARTLRHDWPSPVLGFLLTTNHLLDHLCPYRP